MLHLLLTAAISLLQATILFSKVDVLCPVSRNRDFNKHGNLHYPLEIYNPGLLMEPNISCYQDHHRIANYSCPIDFVACPLIVENLKDADVSQGWLKTTSLCTLKNAFSDKNSKSRVVMFGGSVTYGMDASGCCNSRECTGDHCGRCAWPQQFEHWLRTTTRADVSVHNVAYPGTTSKFSADIVYSFLSNGGVELPLSSKDVVFIDHSFNDNTLSYVVDDIKLERGLEKLLRTLYGLAVSPSDLPHIILLETDTRHLGMTGHEYYLKYRRQAEHYGVRIYSYTDAINKNRTSQVAYHDYLSHRYRHDDHPPWHVHLAYADLFAGMWLSEFDNCTNSAAVNRSYVLPAPLTTQDDSHVCKANAPPLLKISHRDIIANTTIGHFIIPKKNTWEVKLDRKKRGGLIIELNNQSTYDYMDGASLNFTLHGVTAGQVSKMDVMLQLQYMKSYADGGKVLLYMCGSYFADVHALWHDWLHYRYTLQEVITYRLERRCCENKPPDDPVDITVDYVVQGKNRMIERRQPLGAQLFKINSILVCQF